MKKEWFRNRTFIGRIVIIAILSILAFYLGFILNTPEDSQQTADLPSQQTAEKGSDVSNTDTEEKHGSETPDPDEKNESPVFDTKDIDNPETSVSKTNQERKDKYGLNNSIDIIVREDEVIKIGNTTVKMKEILEKIKISKGELVEENLSSGQITANTESKNQPNVTQPESSLSEESTASEKPVKNEQTETPVMTDSDNNNTQNISVVIPVENKPVILSESMQEIEPIINEYGIYSQAG